MKEIMQLAVLTLACIIVLIGIWAGASYCEARAYNNITGKNVSTFDAMFVQLRVQESPRD